MVFPLTFPSGDPDLTTPAELDPKEYVEALGLLRSIDFLQGVEEESLKSILFSLQKQAFPKRKTILFQGEIANRMHILRKGGVQITTRNKGSKILLAELVPPMYFGEISLLRPTSATATVTAGDDGAETLILTHDAMNQLSKKIPDVTARIQQVIDARIAAKSKAKEADEAG